MASGKHHRVRTFVIAVSALVIVAVLALGYANGRGLFTKPAAPMEKLRIALPMTQHAALLYIAVANGYFAQEGLDVTVTPVSHGKAALDLLAEGKVDLASAAEVPFVISVLKGARLGIAATVVSVSTEMAIVARRDRAIAAPHDLSGKRVGVTFGTSGEYFLWAFLIRNRLAPDSVTLVDVLPGQLGQALTQGAVDAVATWEPVKSQAMLALAGNGLSFTAADAYTVTHLVVGLSEFLDARPAALEKMVRALLKAEQFAKSERQQALVVVADQLRLDVNAAEAGWKDLDFKVDLRQSQLITLEDEARWAMERGYADKGPVPNFLPHLYLTALLSVQPERVTVVR